MSEKLLPCPFCGENEGKTRQFTSHGKAYWQVRCEECWATSHGSFHLSESGAVEVWNTRAPQPPANAPAASEPANDAFSNIPFEDDADEVQTWKGLAISAVMDLRRYAYDHGPERRMVSAEGYEADAVRINAASISSDIDRLRFELKSAKNELEIADGEIERLATLSAAPPARSAATSEAAWPKEEIAPGQFVDVDPASLGLKLAVESLPRRKEPISGQTFSYVKLDDVLALIETAAPTPSPDASAVRVALTAAKEALRSSAGPDEKANVEAMIIAALATPAPVEGDIIERCAKIAFGEKVENEDLNDVDTAYNVACEHIAEAIRANAHTRNER